MMNVWFGCVRLDVRGDAIRWCVGFGLSRRRKSRVVHTVGHTGAGGTDIRVAGQGVSLLRHRLAAASTNQGFHTVAQHWRGARNIPEKLLLRKPRGKTQYA